MKYYLYNEHSKLVQTFNKFDTNTIREAIIEQLKVHKLITYEKDNENTDEVGNTVLDLYQINPANGEPSKIFEKYGKMFYFSLVSDDDEQ
jgi:hypothetical protein